MATTQVTSQTEVINPRRAPKSRDGCLRCKSKRMKCDEKKPECLQCIGKNLPCPGYKKKPLVWSTKHEKILAPGSTTSVPASTMTKTKTSKDIMEPQCSQSPDKKPQAGLSFMGSPSDTGSGSSPGNPPQPIPESSASPKSRRDSDQPTDSLSAIRQQLHRSTVPEFLLHLPTMLVEYYFNYVCQIFSSFDGTLNPFRSTVGRLWDGSAPIYFAIQSMAAAYLANHFPRMTSVGVQMQRETYRCLYQVQRGMNGQVENLDKTLLTVLLVGQTTAWHDPKDLGLMHLQTAKRLNRRRLNQQGANLDARERRQNEFFEQCILYWDMLAGFVEDDLDEFGFGAMTGLDSESLETSSNDTSSPASETQMEKVFPHPWTGVAPRVQRLFAQVGRLIRSYRKSTAQDAASLDFLSLDFISLPSTSEADAIQRAQSLEEELLAFEPPSQSNLVDAGDENTPVHQYILLAEAYRAAALLELYRVFPHILSRRVPLADASFAPDNSLFSLLPMSSSLQPESFLLSLALHTISILEKLPSSSGTRCLQPIVLIAAGSELRFDNPLGMSASNLISITSKEVDIATARRFVTSRLREFCQSLPAKPIENALKLVEETWARTDAGQDCFWMDVMQEMGLETIFG